MKIRHLINELTALKGRFGEDFYEKLLEFDFTIKICSLDSIEETQRVGIILNKTTDECEIIAYLDNLEERVRYTN